MNDAARQLYEKTFTEYAEEAMARNDGNVQAAAKDLEAVCRESPHAWMAVTSPVLGRACYDAVRRICQQQRRAIWNAPNAAPGGHGKRVVHHAKTIMQLPLIGGLPLGEGTYKEVMGSAEFYEKQSAQMANFAHFLQAVGSQLHGRKKVKSVFTEAQLNELREQSSGARAN